ncbi:MAG: zinc protease [Desulfuromonadales bacterium C00003068]|nr:MAG: zinc protease [Desulfuromonadales bacterium C00003068]
MGFWVENGARHESRALNGASHFIEHLLFKGTRRRSALDIAKEIDSVGGALNAFTSHELSCYFAKVAGSKLPLAIDLLSDILCHSLFDLDEIEKERRVILQEIHMVEDSPDERIHELFAQKFWPDHPLGRPVLGTPQSVSSLDRSTLLDFFTERYSGSNLIVSAAGDLDHQQVVDCVANILGDLPSGRKAEIVSPVHLPLRQVNILNKKLEQVHLCLGTAALPQGHSQRYVGQILNAILGGSISSRLFQKLREERGMAYSVYSYLNAHQDCGTLVVHAGVSPDDASHAIGVILRELNQLKKQSVSAEELQSAKDQLKGQFMLSMESTDNRMTRLAKNEVYLKRVLAPDEIMDNIDKVSATDIQQLADSLFQDKGLVLQLVGDLASDAFPLMDLTLG